MGLCASEQANAGPPVPLSPQVVEQNKAIEEKMEKEQNIDESIAKLLLLGAGESGKSCLFKQMVELYGNGFNEDERKEWTTNIHKNVILSMQVLATQSLKLASDESMGSTKVKDENKEALERALKYIESTEFNEEVVRDVKALWDDPGIQNTFKHHLRYYILDSAGYYLSKLAEVSSPQYIPTTTDIIRCRARTTGIVENVFVLGDMKFKLIDVGGQRNERKKWIHCFENVTALLFVTSLSGYDQVLYEDGITNRVQESLVLFEGLCNSEWFVESSIIHFMNKRDLFEKKIKLIPLTACFPEFKGNANDYDESIAYIQAQFEAKNKNANKKIYTHVTCATDPENVKQVFLFVKDIIIKQATHLQ